MRYLEDLINQYPELKGVKNDIKQAIQLIIKSYDHKGKLLIAGNGGSAADSEHIVGELMKGFVKERPLDSKIKKKLREVDPDVGFELGKSLQTPLRAISLMGHLSLTSAFNNDAQSQHTLAQQVLGYGGDGDIFIGISTSGKSKNVYAAAVMAKALGMKVILLTGHHEGTLAHLSDVVIHAPSQETYRIQEYHLPIYHVICLEVEDHYF